MMNPCSFCGIHRHGTDAAAKGGSVTLHQREKVLDPLFRLVSLLGFQEM